MELVEFLGADKVIAFMLLFARLSGLIIFFPFYSHNQVPLSVKTLLVFALCIVFFPLSHTHEHAINFLVIEILSEALLGLCAGLLLNIVFAILQMAGEQISMVMGFSMASVLDPQTGTNSPVIANLINFIVLLAFLALDIAVLLEFSRCHTTWRFLSKKWRDELCYKAFWKSFYVWLCSSFSYYCVIYAFRCYFWHAYEDDASV